MKTVYHEHGISIVGKAWEIRTWFKQQLAKTNQPHAPLRLVLTLPRPNTQNVIRFPSQLHAKNEVFPSAAPRRLAPPQPRLGKIPDLR